LLVVMLSLTEVPATTLLLPPGVPNFSQRLLNQMHYARDQHVIASCLLLVAAYLALAAPVVALVLAARGRRGGGGAGGGTAGGCPGGGDGGAGGRTDRSGSAIAVSRKGMARSSLTQGATACLQAVLSASASCRKHGLQATRGTHGGKASLISIAAAAALMGAAAGCDGGGASTAPDVVRIIGSSGRGPGEFLYPRAIALDKGGALYVIDRTGRMQHLAPDGAVLATIELSPTDKGFPTGVTVGPDGLVYVADTHNHRVAVYGADGRMVREFGRFGTGDGEFIYPTHVAVGPDGRIYVSEYGGNDRVSLWSADGRFLGAFGRPGEGRGELQRPSALAVDAARGIIYVADACNHRIASYTLAGDLVGYLGSVGSGRGELRYPYGLALLDGGALAVGEFGNNRVQIFRPDGTSAAVLGGPGRQRGELAYPWGVAAAGHRLYVVDAGHKRIQVWAW
jgi:DNA-binding beta-propeller fold protein YncE